MSNIGICGFLTEFANFFFYFIFLKEQCVTFQWIHQQKSNHFCSFTCYHLRKRMVVFLFLRMSCLHLHRERLLFHGGCHLCSAITVKPNPGSRENLSHFNSEGSLVLLELKDRNTRRAATGFWTGYGLGFRLLTRCGLGLGFGLVCI